MDNNKPQLRMIHNLGRSGSTLMCKCLGCMDGVMLMSELHPLSVAMINPLYQAIHWFGLLTEADIAEIQKWEDFRYPEAMSMIERRCSERGGKLVIRDWAHLDYTGYPYIAAPSYRPMMYEALKDHFDIIRVSTTRDPVDQWLSMRRLKIMQEPLLSGAFSVEKFLAGYRRYAELCLQTGFIRYEDFLREPEKAMHDLCDRLQLPFDPGFIGKWASYKNITGDTVDSRGMSESVIKFLPRRPVEDELRETFLANDDYLSVIAMLGYEAI